MKQAYLHLNFEDDVIVENLFVFAVLYSQLAKRRGGKTPPNLPLINKRKNHSHTYSSITYSIYVLQACSLYAC
jgi:hypothetical protein